MGSDTLCISCNWRKGGPVRFYARLPHPRGAGVSMGSDTFYNKRRLLWEAVRLVWAVTCVRTAPRPVGANCVQAQPAGPVRVYAAHKGAEVPMGSRYVL